MNVSTSYYSAIGGRDKNEDTVSLMENQGSVLGVVADGLGGHEGGEVASKTAITVINSYLLQENVSVGAMKEAIIRANRAVGENPEYTFMGSTVAAIWLQDQAAVVATVGDSRVYQFRDGKVQFQSRDHSLVYASVLAGDMKMEEIRGCKDRNKLIRALGISEDVKPDVTTLDVQPGDAFLLCSDGFWEKILEEEMIEDLCEADSAMEWLKRMRTRVNEKMQDGADNNSAIAILVK